MRFRCLQISFDEPVLFDGGFCIDSAPAKFDWRSVRNSSEVDGWPRVIFEPLVQHRTDLQTMYDRPSDKEKADALAAKAKRGPASSACFNCGECCISDARFARKFAFELTLRCPQVSLGITLSAAPNLAITMLSISAGRLGNPSGAHDHRGWTSPGTLSLHRKAG